MGGFPPAPASPTTPHFIADLKTLLRAAGHLKEQLISGAPPLSCGQRARGVPGAGPEQEIRSHPCLARQEERNAPLTLSREGFEDAIPNMDVKALCFQESARGRGWHGWRAHRAPGAGWALGLHC